MSDGGSGPRPGWIPRDEAARAAFRDVLRAEALRHEPDSARIRKRVNAGIDPSLRAVMRRRLPRLAAVAGGVLVAVTAVGIAVAVGGPTGPTTPVSAMSPTTGKTTHATTQAVEPTHETPESYSTVVPPPPSDAPASHAPPSTTRTTTTTTTTAPVPPGTTASSVLSVTARPDQQTSTYWGQDDVFVTLTRPVTAVRVTISMALVPGDHPTNGYTTSPGGYGVTMTQQGTDEVYTFTLNPGQTVAAGTYQFAAALNSSTKHDVSGDSYSVSVVTDPGSGSQSGSASGGF